MPTFTLPQMPLNGLANGLLPPGMAQTQNPQVLGADGLPYRKPDQNSQFTADGYPLPHYLQMSAILSAGQQTYFHDRWDEARKHGRQNALAMERDVFLQGILQERKLAVSGLNWHIEVDDEKDPYQKSLKDGLQVILRATPYLQRHHYAALDAVWYGRHGIQHRKVWRELDLPAVDFRLAVPADPAAAGGGAAGSVDRLSRQPNDRQRSRYALPAVPRNDPALPPVAGSADEQGAGTDPGGFAARGAPAVLTQVKKLRPCWVVDKHQPVHGDSIGHKWDGTPYILLYSAAARQVAAAGGEVFDPRDPDARPLPPGEITMTTGGSYGLVLRDSYWRDRFVLHSHLSVAAEFFDVDRAEAVHGVGVRDVLYWFWWLKNEWLEWIVTYFERVGLGLTLWYFEAGNSQSYNEMFRLAEQQSRRVNLLVPWYADKRGGGAGGVERVETPTAGAESLLKLIEHWEGYAERYIIGQKLSSDHRGSGGLGGSGAAEFQADTKHQIIKFDAENLDCTYTQDWVQPTLRATFPELADVPARWKFSVPDPAQDGKLEAVTKCYAMGVDFLKHEVRGLTGLSDPQPGDDIIGQPAQELDPETGKPKKDGFGEDDDEENGGDNGEEGGNADRSDAKTHFIRPGEIVYYAGQGPSPGVE